MNIPVPALSSFVPKAVENYAAARATFRSFPIKEQAMFLTNVLSLRNLQQLKLEILDTLEPNKNFEHNIQYAFTSEFFDLFKTWFIKSCYESTKENKLIALNMVESNIKHFEDELFERKPWKS